MSLIKPVPTPIGIEFEYHRIRTLMVYYNEQCVDVFVTSYVSEEHRRSDAHGLDSEQRFTFEELGAAGDEEISRPVVYAALKRSEAFRGAADA